MIPSDVHIDVLSDEMAAVPRQKTGAERLAIARRLYGSARRMLMNHPSPTHLHLVVSVLERLRARCRCAGN